MNFNFEWDIVMTLALFTIGTVLVYAVVSLLRTKKAQDHHDDAAVAKRERQQLAEGKSDVRPTTPHEEMKDDSGRSWSKERGANPPTPTKLPPD
ncbi:hypothetical protein [Erythrobacter sp.]|uniref:hypothetical protein n=1 Tax=Erythrobacter sp. TaxID=1042 RepID=UPI0025D8D767|nr:hypothetical protein [Erythrobacter sp.]